MPRRSTGIGTPTYAPALAASFAFRSAHRLPATVKVLPCVPDTDPPNDSALAARRS